MPSVDANIKNFLFNTDFPMDKIIFLASGNISISAGSFSTAVIAHNLPFTPLPKGSWSTASDWSIAYEESSGPIAPANFFSPFLYGFVVEADATNITATATNYISGSPVTLYYRIYCFEPTSSTADIDATVSSGTNFMLDTDVNYTKLIDAGFHDFASTSGSLDTHIVSYDILNIPQVLFWVERSGEVSQIAQSFYDSGITCQVSTTQAIFTSKDSLAARVHWRVYGDE